MEIICRRAESTFDAVATAQGMENAGANVFSITFNPGMNPMFSFSVFAKYDRELVTPTEIDKAISVQKCSGKGHLDI